MTTTITVAAHCNPDTEVQVTVTDSRFATPELTILQDGETTEKVVFDDRSITIREVMLKKMGDVQDSESTVEQVLPDTPPSFVTEDSINAKIKNVSYHVFEGTTLTHCTITLKNGYTVTGESACVRPENFNKAVGEEWAFKDAFKHLWKLEGYLLKQRLFEGSDLDAGLASSNIKRDNSLALAQMIVEYDALMNSGIDPEHTSVEELAAHQDKYVAMIDLAKEIVAINQSTETLQP